MLAHGSKIFEGPLSTHMESQGYKSLFPILFGPFLVHTDAALLKTRPA